MKHNYPKTRKFTKPWLHESFSKCPQCDFKSNERIVKIHFERWHILRPLRKLLFNNPCIGCLNPDNKMEKLVINDYQKLCMSHRKYYEEVYED